MSASGMVVIGSSIAATTAAATLRAEGYDGPVTLLGDEPHPPYARPPLSKAMLAGAHDGSSALLPVSGLDLVIRTGARAAALDTTRRLVTLADGEAVPYDGLVIASGARARKVSPGDCTGEDPGEWVLRSVDDATRIAAAADHASTALIIGAGVLGIELASSLRARGLAVTVVDVAQPLVAQLGPELAETVVDRARAAGVTVVVSPSGVHRRTAGTQTYVELGDGSTLEAELVVTSAGCHPNVEWLEGSGLPVEAGLLVDERCRVSADVVAAGDVVRVRAPAGAHHRRTPNWTDAINQASTAARALLRGDAAPVYARDPYFWTEAFGLTVKVAGRLPASGPAVVLGTQEDGGRLLQWLEDGCPVAAAAISYRIPVVKLKRLSRALP